MRCARWLPPACRSPKSRRRSGSGLRFRRRPPGTTGTCSRRGRSPAARRRPRRCRFRRSASRPPMRCLRSPVRRNEAPAGVPAAPEALHRRCESLDRHRRDRADPRHAHQAPSICILPRARMDFLLQAVDFRGVADRALAGRALALSVARHKAIFLPEKDAEGGRIDYEAAVSGGLQLVPTGSALEVLADDCTRMVADGMQHGRPSAERRRWPAAMSVQPCRSQRTIDEAGPWGAGRQTTP